MTERQACPCLHTTPCKPNCTCVSPYSSHGCLRCCSYGSAEQQANMARRIAACIKHCDGFPTDTIESGPDMAELVADYTGGASKELIEACRRAHGAMVMRLDGAELNGAVMESIARALKAALDKAEGKS